MKNKLSNFIDSIIENKLDQLEIDIWYDKSKKMNYYSFDMHTITKSSNNPLINYNLHFAVCPETGLVILSKEGYDEFRENDIDLAKKYANILKETNNKILTQNLNLIIESSCKELKLTRDENIKKLIG